MKKYFTATILLLFVFSVFSQDNLKNKDYYLQKSKKQKTAAWLLLGGGLTLSTISVFTGYADLSDDFTGFFSTDPESQNNDTAETILLVTGTAAILSSIPLFIASGKNKKRARAISASLKMDDASIVQGYRITRVNYPVFSLKICL